MFREVKIAELSRYYQSDVELDHLIQGDTIANC